MRTLCGWRHGTKKGRARGDLPGAPDLPRAKGNARPAGHYRELYTNTSRERVATVFADTIEAMYR